MKEPETRFMREAIELAVRNVREGGGPFGAVVVRNGIVIGCGANRVTANNDPTAHAEILAIREACRTVASFRLDGCDLYTTCEPCPMCMGALYWARPARLYYAGTRADAARAGFDDAYIYGELERPVEERALAMRQMLREEALAAFREWERKGDKIPY